MAVPWWWELAQFTSQKCDSVCTDWMKAVDCIVLSGAHWLAVTSLSDSPSASAQRGSDTLLLFGLYQYTHGLYTMHAYVCVCGCAYTAHESALLQVAGY